MIMFISHIYDTATTLQKYKKTEKNIFQGKPRELQFLLNYSE